MWHGHLTFPGKKPNVSVKSAPSYDLSGACGQSFVPNPLNLIWPSSLIPTSIQSLNWPVWDERLFKLPYTFFFFFFLQKCKNGIFGFFFFFSLSFVGTILSDLKRWLSLVSHQCVFLTSRAAQGIKPNFMVITLKSVLSLLAGISEGQLLTSLAVRTLTCVPELLDIVTALTRFHHTFNTFYF